MIDVCHPVMGEEVIKLPMKSDTSWLSIIMCCVISRIRLDNRDGISPSTVNTFLQLEIW